MTDKSPPDKGETATAELLAAFEAFDSFRIELNDLLHEVKLGKTARAKDLSSAIVALSRGLTTLVGEYERVEKYRSKHGGHVHKQALDLATARAEVGSRLARLRAARNPGELSGEPDGK